MKLAACFIVLAACGSDPSGVTVVMTASDQAPAYGSVPFPSDANRDGDHLGTITGLSSLVSRHADIVAAQLAALDGFGVRPLVEFFVDGALDPATLASPGGLVDVDPSSPERGRIIALDWHYDDTRGVLAATPVVGEVLREGTRYAAYVTTAIHDLHGAPLKRAAALDSIAQAPARWKTTADALHELANDQIAGLAVFTTQHATAPLLAARATLDDRARVPAPSLTFSNPAIIFSGTAALDRLLGQAQRATAGPRAGLERWGNDNPTGMAHDHVGVVGTGQMTIARFRRDKAGTHLPDDASFDVDPITGPRVVAIDTIPVTFILPAAAPPQTGYPIVIYGHGLGAGRDQLLSFAEPLTKQGYALVGIDMFGHGSRFDPKDLINNLANKAGFTGVNMPDGFGDNTGLTSTFDFFEGFLNVAASRDSIRQSALDLSRLTELVRTPNLDLSALGAGVKLDTRRVTYLGESFGTVVGTVFAAIEPDIDLYVLDVPGGGIVDRLLPSSAEIGSLALPLIQSIYNPSGTLDRWNPLIHLMQAAIDGGDPLTYATHVLADRFPIGGRTLGPRSVVCLEVVGDQVLANVGTEALARELGLAVLTPDLAPPAGMPEIASPATANRDGQTAVLVQYSPATHGANWSSERGVLRYLPNFPQAGDDPFPKLPAPITIANPIYETLDQVVEILATHQAGESPRVRSTLAPIADFDGDGYPDSQDAAPYDPTMH